MKLNKSTLTRVLSYLVFTHLFSFNISAQIIDFTGFENFEDESQFTQQSWIQEGFSVAWTNGFNQGRAYVDDAHAMYGTKSLRISYPADSYGTSSNGAQAPLRVDPADELYASYWIRFSENFDWGGTYEGGKLPGLAGTGLCSGCQTCTGTNGFTARLMWRSGGKGVLYLYHMDKVDPCGDNITLQLEGSDFYFQKGQWYKIIQRVKINTGDNQDGEVEVWIDEEPALLVTGIRFVNNGNKVDHLYFSTFHGGNDTNWAPSVDCHIWFDNVIIAYNAEDIFGFTGLNDYTINNQVRAYPNPVKSNSTMTIHFIHDVSSSYSTEWYDILGNSVNITQTNTGSSISVPDLNPGIYFLKLTLEKDLMYKRIVVE